MQQDLSGWPITKAHSATSTAAFSPPHPHPGQAPCSINLSLSHPVPEPRSGPRRRHPLFPASAPVPASCPDPAAPSRVRNACTDPHAGLPPPARPGLPSDSEAGGCPLDPTSGSSGTRPCSCCLLACELEGRTSGPGNGTDGRGAGGTIIRNTFPVFLLRLGSHWAQLPVWSASEPKSPKLGMAELPGISGPEHASVVAWLI